MKKKFALCTLLTIVVAYGLCWLCLSIIAWTSKPNENYLQIAKEADAPNSNFIFASNASLAGRIAMTLTPKERKTCINTVTSFFNKYHTCSNCEEFEENPGKWNFRLTTTPKVGDIVIQHRAENGEAYHAAIIVGIKDGKYYVNHAIKTEYYKNVEMKNTARLTFYEFVPECF